jgi:hypothetical protein
MDAPPRLETRIANHSNPMNFPSISMTEIKVGDVLYWPTGQQKYSVVILADLQADGEFVFSTIYADGSSEIRKTPVETSPGMLALAGRGVDPSVEGLRSFLTEKQLDL